MAEEGKITKVHPAWLDTVVPPEYEDEGLYEIILFFVIHSPCNGQSSKGISLTERGWKAKPWYSPKYLKEKLDKAIFGDNLRLLKMVESKAKLLPEINSLDLDDDFYMHRDKQRMLYSKIGNSGCESEYMSMFYHIRNALAHGRLAMYPAKNDDITFVMEDGKQVGKESDDKFEVSARIIINKSSLLNVIELLKNPPKENDYSEDILGAIKNGSCTKCKIMSEVGIDEYTYEKFIQALKLKNMIKFEHKQWKTI